MYLEFTEDNGALRRPISRLWDGIILSLTRDVEGVLNDLNEFRLGLQADNDHYELLPNHLPEVPHCAQ